ncbi:protein of unknown function [Burkholderia multivorans]
MPAAPPPFGAPMALPGHFLSDGGMRAV